MGASSYMTNYPELLLNIGKWILQFFCKQNGHTRYKRKRRTPSFKSTLKTKEIKLDNVLQLENFLFVIVEQVYKIVFDRRRCKVLNGENFVAEANCDRTLYKMRLVGP